MEIVAIDPGPKESAYVGYDTETRAVRYSHKLPNAELLAAITDSTFLAEDRFRLKHRMAIERISCNGMPVGDEVFDTCVWSGRFIQAWGGVGVRMVRRGEVKMHLCGTMRAKDGNIRQAIIDRYGGKDKAIGRKGTKKKPGKTGPLFGVTADMWSALAIAITAAETNEK